MSPTSNYDGYPLQPRPQPSLTLLIWDGKRRQTFPLTGNFYTIGRDIEADIRLFSKGVSRYHASLIWLNRQYYIVDGDADGHASTNGLLVNGQAVKESYLELGDIISFCQDTYAKLMSEPTASGHHQTPEPQVLIESSLANPIDQSTATPETYSLSETHHSDLFQIFPDLVLKLDLNGHILAFNRATDPALAVISYNCLGQSISECFPINFVIKLFKYGQLASRSQKDQSFESSLYTDEQLVHCEVRLLIIPGSHLIVIIRNITERKLLEQKLLQEAAHDSLTGLPNRSLFIKKVTQSVNLKRTRPSYHFAILFIDLDRFKVINDSLGHLTGDQFLIEISIRLKSDLRPQDTIARLGGDEFAILLHDIQTVEMAVEVAERLQKELAKPLWLDSHEIFPSASIGIAFSEVVYESVEEIIRDADIAMYQAKAAGRSRYAVFDHTLDTRSLSFLQLDSSLKRAIERQEFVLYYQPIFELQTQRIIGLEALVRWQHPEEGLLKPEHFLQQAEETGLMVAIGQWALQESCSQLGKWETLFSPDFNIIISVNVSKRQFSDPALIDSLKALIETHKFNTSNFKLEIAEGTLMGNVALSKTVLDQLNDLGIKVLVDDFGTGYSSLSHLDDFPIDALKIDQSFIQSMDKDSTNTGFTIIQSIIGLAHNLGVEVIAEGIECARHVAWLKTLHCDYGQGFYFGEPIPAEQVIPLVEAELAAWQPRP
ncbi:MAG: EAL domain-containing protein [Leptolyngbyaceae cyanobacterium SM2_5_2]|nr:EAL domain-containing protein [Leptolyngbyaceae cyanobacterium SM2_5_2]